MMDLSGRVTFKKTYESYMWLVIDSQKITFDDVSDERVGLEVIDEVYIKSSDGKWTSAFTQRVGENNIPLSEDDLDDLESHRMTLDELQEISRMNSL